MVRKRAIEAESVMQSSDKTPGFYNRKPTSDKEGNNYAKPMNAWDSCWE